MTGVAPVAPGPLAADRHRLSFIETVLPEAASRGTGVIAMKVYGGGTLVGPAGLTAEEALGYAFGLEGVSTAIVGCRTPAEVEENVRIARSFGPRDEAADRDLERRTARHA